MTTTMPCRDCGRTVTSPTDSEQLVVHGRLLGARGQASQREGEMTVPMTRCDDCTARRARARAVLEAHPTARRPRGSLSYVLDFAGDALAALDLLGVGLADQQGLVRTDRDVLLLLAHLGDGGSVLYSERRQPVVDPRGEAGSKRPWEHVAEDRRQGLRDAYAEMLRVRVERPTDTPPPDDGAAACLLCGVGALRVVPSRAREAWGTLRQTPKAPGAPGREQRVSGHVCPDCARAARDVDGPVALGPTAVQRAVLHHLGVRVPPWGEVVLEDVRPWAMLPDGTPPNETPWAHLPLDRLAEDARLAVAMGSFGGRS